MATPTTFKHSKGKFLLGLVAFIASVGGYVFDWNETHVYNPRWPPHAKFHNGQTMSTGLLLGIAAFYYLLRGFASPAVERDSVWTATLLVSLNWVAQLSGALYPGALPVDPEFGTGFPQAYICSVLLAMAGLGLYMEEARLAGMEKED